MTAQPAFEVLVLKPHLVSYSSLHLVTMPPVSLAMLRQFLGVGGSVFVGLFGGLYVGFFGGAGGCLYRVSIWTSWGTGGRGGKRLRALQAAAMVRRTMMCLIFAVAVVTSLIRVMLCMLGLGAFIPKP